MISTHECIMSHRGLPKLTGTVPALQASILHRFRYFLRYEWQSQNPQDVALAVSLAVRNRLTDRLLETDIWEPRTRLRGRVKNREGGLKRPF